jgi:hypothetical protein
MCATRSKGRASASAAVRRLYAGAPRPSQRVASQAEQPAATFGLHHLLGGEAEAVQVFDQRGTLARVGDSGGLQRIEIEHPPESASVAPD